MPPVEYPVHMYKDLNATRYAHDRKAVEALMLDGWTDIRSNVPRQEYPKTLYHIADGETIVIGQYGKDGVVDLAKARADEEAYLNTGYSLTFVPKHEQEAPAPLSFNEALTGAHKQAGRIEAVEQGLASLGSDFESVKSDVAELKSGIAAILEKLTAPKE